MYNVVSVNGMSWALQYVRVACIQYLSSCYGGYCRDTYGSRWHLMIGVWNTSIGNFKRIEYNGNRANRGHNGKRGTGANGVGLSVERKRGNPSPSLPSAFVWYLKPCHSVNSLRFIGAKN